MNTTVDMNITVDAKNTKTNFCTIYDEQSAKDELLEILGEVITSYLT